MAVDTIGIGQYVVESNIRMVTQTIRNHLLDVQINHSQKSIIRNSFKSIAPHDYSKASSLILINFLYRHTIIVIKDLI